MKSRFSYGSAIVIHSVVVAGLLAVQGCAGLTQKRSGLHGGQFSSASSHQSRSIRQTSGTRGTPEHFGILKRIRSAFSFKSPFRSSAAYHSGTSERGQSSYSGQRNYSASAGASRVNREIDFPPRRGTASSYQGDRVSAASTSGFSSTSSASTYATPAPQRYDSAAPENLARSSAFATPATGFRSPTFDSSSGPVGGTLISSDVSPSSLPAPSDLVESGQFPPSSPTGLFGGGKVAKASFSPGYIAPLESYAAPSASTTVTVRKGDNLTKIARRQGVTVNQLRAWNGMKSDLIRAGQTLVLNASSARVPAPANAAPAPQPKTSTRITKPVFKQGANGAKYKVVSGDSLSAIAYKFGIKTSALKSANGLASDRIQTGWTLIVPNPTKTPPTRVFTQEKPADGGPPIVKTFAKPDASKPSVNVTPTSTPAVIDPTKFDAGFKPVVPATLVKPAAPVTQSIFASESELFEYVVLENDTLSSIAGAFITTVGELKKQNPGIAEPLKSGSLVKIPPLR